MIEALRKLLGEDWAVELDAPRGLAELRHEPTGLHVLISTTVDFEPQPGDLDKFTEALRLAAYDAEQRGESWGPGRGRHHIEVTQAGGRIDSIVVRPAPPPSPFSRGSLAVARYGTPRCGGDAA